jgi:glutathione S-transferase
MFFGAGPLDSMIANQRLGFIPESSKGFIGYGSYENVISNLKSGLEGKSFITGESFTIADIYISSLLRIGIQFGVIQINPIFENYFARLTSRPSFIRAHELSDTEFKSLLEIK